MVIKIPDTDAGRITRLTGFNPVQSPWNGSSGNQHRWMKRGPPFFLGFNMSNSGTFQVNYIDKGVNSARRQAQ